MNKLLIAIAFTACVIRAEAPFDANMTGGRIHYGGQRFEKAANLFKTATEQKPTSYEAHLWLAASYAKLQKKIEAAKEFARVLELDSVAIDRLDAIREPNGRPEGKELAQMTLFAASVLSLQAEKLDEGMVFIKAALKINPFDSDNLLQLTRVALKMGNFDEVKKTALAILARDSNSADAYTFLARYYVEKGQWDSAKVEFNKGLGLLTKRYEVARDTAIALWHLTSESELLGILEALDSLRTTPDKFRAFLQDSLKLSQKQFEQTGQLFKILFDSWYRMVIGYGEAGRCAFDKLDMEYAEQMYGQAAKLDPKNGDVIYNLGIVKYNRAKYDEAKELLVKTAELFPNDDHVFTLLGHVYLLTGEELLRKNQNDAGNKEIDNSIKALERAVLLNPKNGDAYRFLGIAYAHKGDTKKAEEFLKKGQDLMKEAAPK